MSQRRSAGHGDGGRRSAGHGDGGTCGETLATETGGGEVLATVMGGERADFCLFVCWFGKYVVPLRCKYFNH